MADTVVVDCSVAAKWLLPEPGEEAALELHDRWTSGEVRLIAPDLLLTEFASLLAKRVRRKLMVASDALRVFEVMMQTAPYLYDSRAFIKAALYVAVSHHISVWDSVYVALAIDRKCSVVTADRRLTPAGVGRHPTIVPL